MIAALHLQYLQALPWVIGVLGALTLLVLLTYPGQLGHLSLFKRWLLPPLRILALWVLGLSVLRPVLTRQRVSTERAPIVIVFDDSRSMGVIDSARAPAEIVGIASALGKLPPETRDRQTQAIQSDCDLLSNRADEVARARAELDYARLAGRGQETATTRLDQAIADLQATARDAASKTSASMKNSPLERTLAYLVQIPAGIDQQTWLDRIRDKARAAATYIEQVRASRDAELFRSNENVRDACRPLQELTRLGLAQSVVFDTDSGLLARLGVDTSVLGYGISDQVTPIAMRGHDSVYQPLVADGSFSNLTGGIRTILNAFAASPPRAIVLLSDGRQTNADADIAAAASQGVPIFTVGVASRSGIRDLSIQNVTIQGTATVGETITLRAELRAMGLNGTSSSVTISGGGSDETRAVNFADDRPVVVQFNRQFATPGMQKISLELVSVPGEMSYENNRIERWINVLPRSGTTQTARQSQPPQPATRPVIEAELADLGGDEGTLRRLAEASGGQFFRLDQLEQLATRLRDIHDDVNHPIEVPLWDGSYLLAIVLGCLTAEWGLRKRVGLA